MRGFKASINLQFDLHNIELLHRYLLSTSHAEVLRGVLESLGTSEGMHAHLLVGPYGTGKSFVATILCQILSKQLPDGIVDKLLEQADRFDTLLSFRLQQVLGNGASYIPVIINGKTGSFRKIVGQAVYRSLQQAGVHIATPNEVLSVLHTVELWERSYPQAYAAFLQHLSEQNWSQAEWKDQVEGYNDNVIRKFVEFYPSVTSGSQWVVDQEEHFIENMQRIVQELCARNTGLLIVYDEFGRFLQSLSADDAIRSMQDLQDLAELANNSNNIQLLVVGHKHIRQYAVQSREHIRSEFEKVEKRFRFYSLETDPHTYLRLAHEAGAEINERCLPEATILETVDTLQGYALFMEFTPYQLEHTIIRGLYPLHPAAVALLPYLSSVLGQNERTLFSFFADDERFGLRDHIEQGHGYYYADKLFHYFHVDGTELPEHPALQLYYKIYPYIAEQEQLQRRIIELMTLWAVSHLSQKQPLTAKFISFALGVTRDEAEDQLMQLTFAKLVRYNQIREHWELFDGSSIDVDAVIAEKLISRELTKQRQVDILDKHLPTPYLMPHEYNDEMHMLRYAALHFVWVTDLEAGNVLQTTADDQILFVLFDEMKQAASAADAIAAAGGHALYAVPKFSSEEARPDLHKYDIIDGLLHDAAFLAQDPRVKHELQFLLMQTSARIRMFVEKYFAFGELEWRSGAHPKNVQELMDLEQLVAARLREKFPNTPHIRNEAFNRTHISSVQKRAVIDVIDRIIRSPAEPNLGIEGYGPNYLIYASVLKNNGYRYDPDGQVHCDESLLRLKDAIERILADRPTGRLADLIRLCSDRPYGLRAAVIPVLFVALLRDRWERMMFYAHDMYITHLSGEDVLELIEKADEYEYRHFDLSEEERRRLIDIGKLFALDESACGSMVHVAQGMLSWLRALPKFTQITSQLSEHALQIRDFIRAAEVDPHRNIMQIAANGALLEAAMEEMEQFMQTNEAELVRQMMLLTKQQSKAHFVETLEHYRIQVIGMNSRLLTVNQAIKDEDQMLEVLIHHLVGVARPEWSDATQELFLKQLSYEWQLLQTTGEAAPTVELPVPVDPAITFSKKTQLLYTNVKNLLKYAGKDVAPQELKQLLLKLLQEV